MIGAKTMIRSLCGRLFTMCAFGMSVAVVTISPSLSAPDFGAADALMLRLMLTYNVSGAALALIKDGGIVLEKPALGLRGGEPTPRRLRPLRGGRDIRCRCRQVVPLRQCSRQTAEREQQPQPSSFYSLDPLRNVTGLTD
jgi:hypothetical protein